MEEPDWDELRANVREWFADAEGCAVCEIYGMRNGGVLEQKAAEIIREKTGLPVVCASELFSGLSSLERAASAVLNAGLLPITQDFIAAVTRAFRERGIDAEILIVRSDSSLMGAGVFGEARGRDPALRPGCLRARRQRADRARQRSRRRYRRHDDRRGAHRKQRAAARRRRYPRGAVEDLGQGTVFHLVRARRRQRHPLGQGRRAHPRAGPNHPAVRAGRTVPGHPARAAQPGARGACPHPAAA